MDVTGYCRWEAKASGWHCICVRCSTTITSFRVMPTTSIVAIVKSHYQQAHKDVKANDLLDEMRNNNGNYDQPR